MTTMFARHTVKNYENWKHVYDEFATVRKANGVTAASVYRVPDNGNSLIIVHQFKNKKAATDFANSEELKSAMAKAGVNGAPEIWFGEDVETVSY